MMPFAAVSEITEKAEQLRRVNLAIEKTEKIFDAAMGELERMREWRNELIREIERLAVEDAAAYPSVVFDEHRPFDADLMNL